MHKIFLYFCTALVLASCGKVAQEDDSQRIFRMNLPTGLSTLDPAYAGDQASWWMTNQLFNTLVEFDSSLQLRPSLAKSYIISDSGRTYTFHLRQDAYFHKDAAFGPDSTRKLVAADVLYSFSRICDSAVAARGFWIFNGKVKGANEYNKGLAKKVEGFSAPNDSTFIISLTEPYPPFLQRIAMPYGGIVPQEIVDLYGKDFSQHPIGTGPFKFKSWKPGRSLILLRNPGYWETDTQGRPLPYVDAVHARFITERLTEFVELCQGRFDFVNSMDKSTRDEVFLPEGKIKPKYAEQFNFMVSPTLNTEYLSILVDSNSALLQNHPLRDRRVRQALNLAIDRQQLVDYVLNGQGTPAYEGIVPPGMPGFDADAIQGYGYNPEKAAALLKEAGYPGGVGMPTITLMSNPSYQAIMEFIQKSFERLGIKLEIDNLDGPTLRDKASKGELHLWRSSWVADYPDPENYLGLFYSPNIPPNGSNRTRFSDPLYDARFRQCLSTTNDSLRLALQHAMENQLVEAAPVIFLFYDRMIRIISKKVTGLETNAMNMLILKRVKKAA
jgi:oligopeptide transport system substrate-binding protein